MRLPRLFRRRRNARSPPPSPGKVPPNKIDRLRARGIRIGKNCSIYDVTFDNNVPGLIDIGDDCILTHDVIILAHDAAPAIWTDQGRLARTRILDRVFVGQRSIILPGVTIGPDAIVAAGSVVTKDVPPRTVVAGVPARRIMGLDEYLARLPAGRGRLVRYGLPGLDSPDRDARRREGEAALRDVVAQMLAEEPSAP